MRIGSKVQEKIRDKLNEENIKSYNIWREQNIIDFYAFLYIPICTFLRYTLVNFYRK